MVYEMVLKKVASLVCRMVEWKVDCSVADLDPKMVFLKGY
jgi:hypothetical protein